MIDLSFVFVAASGEVFVLGASLVRYFYIGSDRLGVGRVLFWEEKMSLVSPLLQMLSRICARCCLIACNHQTVPNRP